MDKKVIEIRDRINQAINDTFGSFYYAAKEMNKSPSFFYGYRNLQSIDAINEMCKLCDVSLEYILNGGKKRRYSPVKPTYKGLLKFYSSKRGNHETAETQTIFRIRHGMTRIGLYILTRLAEKYKTTVYELIV